MFVWPDIEDVSVIHRKKKNIVKVLPEPNPGRHGEFIFRVALVLISNEYEYGK